MQSRDDALAQIITIAQDHEISGDEITAALSGRETRRSAGHATRLFSYLGGIFIFAGIAAYASMFWDDMNGLARVILTFGSGFVLYILAVIAMKSGRSDRVTPLLLISQFLQPAGLFVALHEWVPHLSEPRYAGLAVFGVMALQQIFTFQATRHIAPIFYGIGFSLLFFITGFDLLHVPFKCSELILGISLMCLSYGLSKTSYAQLRGYWYLLGSVFFLHASFEYLRGTPFEIFYLGITCVMIYIAVISRSGSLLLISVGAMLCYIGYFTVEHFAKSAGWPVTLILLGVVFSAISAGTMRIRNKYMKA